MTLNAKFEKETNGIQVSVDYAALATDKLRVQALIDLLQQAATQEYRGHMDQIAPPALNQLLAELEAIYDAVT